MTRYITLIVALLLGLSSFAQSDSDQLNRQVGKMRIGKWRIEGRNGKVEEGEYVEGKKHGEWTMKDGNGTYRSRVTFDHGVPKGPAVYYFPDGSVMEQGTWNFDHWEGDYVRYYQNGNKSCEFFYDNTGRRTGHQTYYHENGNMMFDGNWENGKISGALSIYNEEGVKVMERTYDKTGNYTGSQQADAPPSQAGSGKTFKGTGTYTLFNSKGKKDQSGRFVNGQLIDGEKYFYDNNGKLSRTEKYRGGKPVGK